MDLNGSVAIVSGGGSGLGRATAARLNGAGARVVVVDLEREDVAAAVESIGRDVTFAPADVTDEEEVRAAIETARARGPIRILVNCAGVAPSVRVSSSRGIHPLDVFARTLTINVSGTFNLTRLVFDAMRLSDPIGGERGVIVNTASVAAFEGQIGQAAYAASKAAVAGMTLPLAREFAGSLVRVVTIAPGIFETPMLAGLPAAAQESLGQQVPHPARLGIPDEFAALVEHIVSNHYLNGETIRLDGAIRMAPR